MAQAQFNCDLDGTLVDDHHYPEMGDWLPGAVEALRKLKRLGKVTIYSCRLAPYAYPAAARPQDDISRPSVEVLLERNRIYTMLHEQGLEDIEVWTRPYKPPGYLIDNHGIRFTGDWDETFEHLLDALAGVVPVQNQLTGEQRGPGKVWQDWMVLGTGMGGDRPLTLFDDIEPLPEDLFGGFPDEESLLASCEAEPSEYPDMRTCQPDVPVWMFDEGELLMSFPLGVEVRENSQGQFFRVPDLLPDRHPSSARFHAILQELAELHDEKAKGYGTDEDPLANVRASAEWGMPAWVGALLRGQDKIKRLQVYAQKGELPFESVEDAFKDLAVYAILGLVLFEQERREQGTRLTETMREIEVRRAAEKKAEEDIFFRKV